MELAALTLNSRSLVLTLLGLLAAVPANVFAQDGSLSRSIPPAELETFVDGLIGKAMDGHRVAGVAVSIVQNGHVVLNKGYGVASLSPARAVDPDTTLFHIGSITKTFTSILLMREVEAGRLSLDDPVNQHLPASLQIPDEGFSKPIRVRDLMTHQPGFEDTALGHLFVLDASRIRPLSLYLQQERPRRVREPGALSSYSNYGFALAGAMLEHGTGKSWQELVESNLLHPLGVTQMTAREFYPPRSDLPSPMPAELASHLSEEHSDAAPQASFSNRSSTHTRIAPAGAMSASAGAMARYMLMLLNDGTLDGATLFNLESAKVFRRPMTTQRAGSRKLGRRISRSIAAAVWHSRLRTRGFDSHALFEPCAPARPEARSVHRRQHRRRRLPDREFFTTGAGALLPRNETQAGRLASHRFERRALPRRSTSRHAARMEASKVFSSRSSAAPSR